METTHKPGTERHLYCNCCGRPSGRFAQHWNRDTGYGICRPCVLRWYRGKGESESEIENLFGKEGVNWANAEQWAEIEAANA